MKLSEARIGYAGYSRDFSVPGDRRRFAAYARMNSLRIEYADLRADYDLAYVTYNSDLPGWVARKRREGDRLKLVFELVDSYLTETGWLRRHLKGTARYLLGIDTRLGADLQRSLRETCMIADSIVCSTEEQAAAIRRFNPNIFLSFDYFGDDLGKPKLDYRRQEKLRLVWEGQATTLRNLLSIQDVLNAFRDQVELHVVTDPIEYLYFGRFVPRQSARLLSDLQCDVRFHPWHRQTFSRIVTSADVAIIPINRADRFANGKPANKLAMLWQLGMPVLASNTPAYRRAMDEAGLDLLCIEASDWRSKLERLIETGAEELERIGRKGRAYAEQAYSKAEFLARLDAPLEAIGFSLER